MAIDNIARGLTKTNAIKFSASNFNGMEKVKTNSDGSQQWKIKWINNSQSYEYLIDFPKGVSALVGSYNAKLDLETAFPTGIGTEQMAMVYEGENVFLATYNSTWNYKRLNNKVIFRKTDTEIQYKFDDEDDSNWKQMVLLDSIRGKSPDFEWNNTSIRFKNPDNTWGNWVNLIGKPPKTYWFDNTKLSFEDGNGGITDPVELKGVGVKGSQGDSPSIYDVYSNSDGDIVFKIKTGDILSEVEFDKGLNKVASMVSFGEYMGVFDINNLPTNIKKGWFWRVQTPFTYNGKQYPSGSLIIANKTKTSSISELDFDFFTNRNSSVNIKIEEQRFDIAQDTYQVTLDNFDISKDGLLVTVSGGNRAGAVILNEGLDFNIINGNTINIISTKLINGDVVIVKKYIGVKEAYTKTWKSGENYFKDELIKSLANNLIYVCIKDVVNSTIDPSLDVEHFKGISFTTSIPTFVKGNNYAVDNVVIDPNDESIYKCIKAITNAQIFPKDDATFTTWKPLIKQGEGIYSMYLRTTTDNPPLSELDFQKSLHGKGITFKGTYDNNKRYYLNDMVTYNGIAFVCTNDIPLGIVAEIPNENNTTGSWTVAMVSNVNSGSIIRDDLNNAPNFCYSILKTNQELNLRALRTDVLIKGSETPYEATTIGSPVSKGYLETYVKNITMDSLKDGVTYKLTHNDFDDGLKSKLMAISDNNKGVFSSVEQLQLKYPNGNTSSRDGDVAIVLGNGNGHWYYYFGGSWSDSGSNSSTIDGMNKAAYDSKNKMKDIYDVTYADVTPERDFVTLAQKTKLDQIDVHAVDGVKVVSSTRKDSYTLVYDSNLDMFIYKKFTNGDVLNSYSYDTVKRIDLKADADFTNRFYYVLDTTLKIPMLYNPVIKTYIQDKRQSTFPNFPLNPLNNEEIVGLDYIYSFDSANSYWKVKSEVPKSDATFQNIKTNVLSPISNILEFKDSTNTTSLGNIDVSNGINKLTWQNDLDVKGKATVTGNISSGATISATTRVTTPELRANTIQPVSLDGTSLVRMYDSGGNLQISLNPTTQQTIFTKDVVDKENVSIEKDLTVTGKIINSDLTQRLLKAGSYIPKTSAERITYINDINNTSTVVIYDTNLDKQFVFMNGYCYESPDGVTSPPTFPAKASITDGVYYYDTTNNVIYKWSSVLQYWGFVDQGFIDKVTGLTTTLVDYTLSTNVMVSVSKNTTYTISLKTSRAYSKFSYVLRQVKSTSAPTTGEIILKNSVTTLANTLTEGNVYDLTVNDKYSNQIYSIRFVFIGTNFLIQDRWQQVGIKENTNDYEIITTADRKISGAVPTPTGVKTYFDSDLVRELTIGSQNVWYEYVGEIITSFPLK